METAMALITEYRTPARPNYRLVEVYDADAYLTDSAAVDLAHQHVVGGNGYHLYLYLYSLQPDVTVEVAIRVWDAPRQPPTDVEGTLPVTIESETGILVVGQLTLGPAGEMTLPRPGVFEGTLPGRDVPPRRPTTPRPFAGLTPTGPPSGSVKPGSRTLFPSSTPSTSAS